MKLPPRILISLASPHSAHELGFWKGLVRANRNAAQRTGSETLRRFYLDVARSYAEEARRAYDRIAADQHRKDAT